MSASSIQDRHARLRERDEPTRTKTVRSTYASRLRGAWAGIKAAMRTGIIERDVLGLRTQGEALANPPTERDFRFDTDASKIRAFDRWLQAQAEGDILDVYGGENQYIRRAYEGGVREATMDLEALGVIEEGGVGASTNLPIHKEQVQAIFTRNFGELQGMTDEAANNMRRVLSEGLSAGDGPYDIAGDLSDVIGKVDGDTATGQMARANRIARTEVLNSHNTARAKEYQRHGVEKVTIILAADACPICVDLKANGPYKAENAAGLVPASSHPNCRCALAPVTGT